MFSSDSNDNRVFRLDSFLCVYSWDSPSYSLVLPIFANPVGSFFCRNKYGSFCSRSFHSRSFANDSCTDHNSYVRLTRLFSADAIPERFRWVVDLNPLAWLIEACRKLLISGDIPQSTDVLLLFFVSFAVCWLGYFIFQRTRIGFADVL